jgi:hypothetical protein
MKKMIMFFILSTLVIGGLLAQDPSVSESLQFLGIPAFWAGIIATILIVVGKIIPNKYTDILYYVGRILMSFNNESKAQKEMTAHLKKEENYFKVRNGLVIGLLLLTMSFAANAQSPWDGFFKPIKKVYQPMVMSTTDSVNFTATYQANQWLFRPSLALTAVAIDFKSENPMSLSLNSIGMGVSYGKYSLVEDVPYCTYSVNLNLLTSIKVGDETSTNIGLAVTADVFNKFIGAGVGYINQRVMLLTTVSYSF